MGQDLHIVAERMLSSGRYVAIEHVQPFVALRDYTVHGLLGGRGDELPELAILRERHGIPPNASAATREYFESDKRSLGVFCSPARWLTMRELDSIDWSSDEHGGPTGLTYRQALPRFFFRDLRHLKRYGADRVVYWFTE